MFFNSFFRQIFKHSTPENIYFIVEKQYNTIFLKRNIYYKIFVEN